MVARETIPDGVPGESAYVETNGVRLHTIQAGPEDGPLVVLLHGFPEFWYAWHDQLRPLVNAGFRVVAPDQRGYNRSDKPDDVDAYRIDELTGDVLGLLDALDRDRASVVGHDWGGGIAWWLALHHPERVDRLGVCNAPHPTVFERTLRRSWAQRFRSWYVLWYQLPRVPESVLGARDCRLLERALCDTSSPGTFSAADLARYRTAWRQPGALTGMLNWYRAAARERPRPRRTAVDVPALVVWGARDVALKRSMARESVDACADGRLVLLDDATHWVQHEEPVRVADELVGFLGE